MKSRLTNTFLDEIYYKPPIKKYRSNKIVYNHIDKTWSIDLADMIDYKSWDNKKIRYIIIIIDNLSKNFWAIPLEKKYSHTITNEFSNILTTSKRKLLKLESDRGTELYKSIFQNFLNTKNFHHYSRFTGKGASIAETVIRTVRNLLKKPIFLAGNADWLSELTSVIKQYNNTTHHSIKMSPNQTSKKSNEKLFYFNLQDQRVKQKPKKNKDNLFVQLIKNESSAKETVPIIVINFIH